MRWHFLLSFPLLVGTLAGADVSAPAPPSAEAPVVVAPPPSVESVPGSVVVELPTPPPAVDCEKYISALNGAESRLEANENSLAICRGDLGSMNGELQEVKGSLDQCNGQVRELEERKKLETSSAKDKEALIACESRVAKMELTAAEIQNQAEKCSSRLGDLQIEKELADKRLNTRLADTEQRLKDEVGRYQNLINDLQSTIKTLQAKYNAAEEQLAKTVEDTYVISIPRIQKSIKRVATLSGAFIMFTKNSIVQALPTQIAEDGKIYSRQFSIASQTAYQVHLAPLVTKAKTFSAAQTSRIGAFYDQYASGPVQSGRELFVNKVLPILVIMKNNFQNNLGKLEFLTSTYVVVPFLTEHPEVKEILPSSPRYQIISIFLVVGSLIFSAWTLLKWGCRTVCAKRRNSRPNNNKSQQKKNHKSQEAGKPTADKSGTFALNKKAPKKECLETTPTRTS